MRFQEGKIIILNFQKEIITEMLPEENPIDILENSNLSRNDIKLIIKNGVTKKNVFRFMMYSKDGF